MAVREALPLAHMRIDKWLWAARFYKTRSLASEAVVAGHVRLNGHPVKPAREVRAGDAIELTHQGGRVSIVVKGLNLNRRPAPEARQLYEETPESIARRVAEQEARRLAPPPGSDLRGRPTKRARRRMREIDGS